MQSLAGYPQPYTQPHQPPSAAACADAPMAQEQWRKLHQAKMVTWLGTESKVMRNYFTPPDVMAYAEQVLLIACPCPQQRLKHRTRVCPSLRQPTGRHQELLSCLSA